MCATSICRRTDERLCQQLIQIQFRMMMSSDGGTHIPSHDPRSVLNWSLFDLWQIDPPSSKEAAIIWLRWWCGLVSLGFMFEFLPPPPFFSLSGLNEFLRSQFGCPGVHREGQTGRVNPGPSWRTESKPTSEGEQDGDRVSLAPISESRIRISLPLTVTDTDTTCWVVGQGGHLGSRTMHLLKRTANSLPLRRWGPRAVQKLSPSRLPCPHQFGASGFPITRALATHSMTTTSPESFSSPNLPTKFGNFDLIRTEKLGLADIVFSKYRSRETGLTVVHLDYEGTWRVVFWSTSVQIASNISPFGEWLLCCGDRKYVLILWGWVISS